MEALTTKHALVLRIATEKAEIDHLRQTLNQGHYLKAERPAGHVLWQGIHRTDSEADCPELVAVLCWGGAAKRLKERDTSLWKEDASRPRKKASGAQVLALLRGAVLRLHDEERFESLDAGFHHHAAKAWDALRLLKTPPPQIN